MYPRYCILLIVFISIMPLLVLELEVLYFCNNLKYDTE